MHSTAEGLRACRQLALLSALSLVVGCSFEDHPSLGRYEPLPAQPSMPATNDDGRAGDSAPAGSGGKAAAAFVPTPDGGAGRTAAPTADAAGPDLQPIGDSGAIDSSVIAEPRCDGVYAGIFTCTVSPPLITPLTTNEIAVRLTLQQAQGAALATARADLVFTLEGYSFDANISGQLDCGSTVFSADIVDGLVANPLAPIPIPFAGMIDGELDRTSRSLAGSWSFTPEAGDTCVGNWSAQLQP